MKQIHITRFTITRQGEVRYFSIRLPPDVQRVIGVETGLFVKNQFSASEVNYQNGLWIQYRRNRVMGLLKLQATGKSDVFYAAELKEQERNCGLADFSKEYYVIPKVPVQNEDGRDYEHPVRFWNPQHWTHGTVRGADPVEMDTFQQSFTGYFRDEYGKMAKQDTEYTVLVYIWYEIKKQ